jgi:hypothetical protein
VSLREHESCLGSWSSNEVEWRDEEEILARILCRLGELKHAGCDQPDCVVLAGRLDVPLKRALTLLARGCPPGLAVRILA